MGTQAPDIYTVSHAIVVIQDITKTQDDGSGMSNVLFTNVTPPSWSIDAPMVTVHGDAGMPLSFMPAIQNPTYGDMSLSGGFDKDAVLATWKALIEDPGTPIDQKKKDTKVLWMQSDGKTIVTGWHTTKGLMVSYDHGPSDASSNNFLTVNITIRGEQWEHLGPGGSPIQKP